MKSIFLLFLNFICINLYGQVGTYEFIELEKYESFELKKDSFKYEHSIGLCHGIILGTISKSNDTIILNSELQPKYKVNSTYDDKVGKDNIQFEVTGIDFPNYFGFRVCKGKEDHDLSFRDNEKLFEEIGDNDELITYTIPRSHLKQYDKFHFLIYRTNLRIQFDWRNKNVNKYSIDFIELPEIVDYEFFTNQKAVFNGDDLILLNRRDKPIEDYYIIRNKKSIKISKRKRVKKYKRST